jgi:hypothetical protein
VRFPGPAAALLLLIVVESAAGQSVPVRIQATPQVAWVSHDEIDESLEQSGFGIGASIGVSRARWAVDLEAVRASLDPAADAGPSESFRLTQLDLRASYRVVPAVALLIGASRRWISPEFAAPDVGFVRLGLLTETAVTRQAKVWARGAYAVAPHFNGGGSAGLALEIGLGTWIGAASGRYGLRVEYDFQRLDRTVNGTSVPVQMTVAKAGLQLGL